MTVVSLTLVPLLTFVIAESRYDSVGESSGWNWCSDPNEYFGCHFSLDPTPAQQARADARLIGFFLDAILLMIGFGLLWGAARNASGPKTRRWRAEGAGLLAIVLAVLGLTALAIGVALLDVFAWPVLVAVHGLLLWWAFSLSSKAAAGW